MRFIATIIVSIMIAIFAAYPVQSGGRGAPVNAKHHLTADEDGFYAKFGGRVFHLWCGKRQVFIWKRADHRAGYFHCSNGRTSSNAYKVRHTKRGWERIVGR